MDKSIIINLEQPRILSGLVIGSSPISDSNRSRPGHRIYHMVVRLFLFLVVGLSFVQGATEGELMALINRERAKRGLEKLVVDESLTDISRSWARTMAKKKKMFHNEKLGDHLKTYGWKMINENVFYASDEVSSKKVVEGWMKSWGHRDNLLYPEMNIAGVGISRASDGFYVVFNGARTIDKKMEPTGQ